MQELMAATDIGMTDYSSWAYDFILTGRPLFIYAPDLDYYAGGRGFYYPIETTPFPISRDQNKMIEDIRNFDDNIYRNKVKEFLEDKGCYETGSAASKTADLIIDEIRGEHK